MILSAVGDSSFPVLDAGAIFAAALAVILASILSAVVSRRALEPALPWRAALVRSAHDQAHSTQGMLRIERRQSPPVDATTVVQDTSLQDAGLAVTLIASAFLGLVGALGLALSGHAPSTLAVLGPVLVAGAIAVGAAIRVARPLSTRSVLARRWARLLASGAFAEVSSAIALVITVAVVMETAGLTVVSVVEVAAITLATRLAICLTPWPGGLGIADIVLLVPLLWIGVPIEVGMAAVLVWRAGSCLAVMGAIIVARHTRAESSLAARPPVSDWGRPFHRTLFALVSLMPTASRDRVRCRLFDAMFAVSEDPWGYQGTPYEQRKREHLLAAVGSDVATVVEIGSADGHNLAALAARLPMAAIIGMDVSRAAVAVARERTHSMNSVSVFHTNQRDELAASLDRPVDCVVFAEMLYYLGSERAMRSELGWLCHLVTPDCRVVLLHGAADASGLHERAARALGLRVVSSRHVDDPERGFVVTVAVMDY